MAKPNKAQLIFSCKATESSPQDRARGSQKVQLLVTAHTVWLGEGQELPMADIESVKLTENRTVTVRMIGRSVREFATGSADEARQLRACLVFHARYTRGGFPGVTDWRQLLDSPYTRLDVQDVAMPAAARPLATPESSAVAAAAQKAARPFWKTPMALVLGGALLAAVVVVVVLTGGSAGKSLSSAEYERLMTAGNQAFDKAQFAEALTAYEQARTGDPKSAELNGRIGESYLKLGRQGEAIPFLVDAVRYDNVGEPRYAVLLAQTYIKENDPDKAAQVLDKARRRFADNLELNLLLAESLDRRGLVPEALAMAQKVYRERPELIENTRRYAKLLEKSGQLGEASKAYLTAARTSKSYSDFSSAIASMGKSGDLKTAEGLIAEARRALPTHAALRRSDHEVLVAMGAVPKDQPTVAHPAPQPSATIPPLTETPAVVVTGPGDVLPTAPTDAAAPAPTDQPAAGTPVATDETATGLQPQPGVPAVPEPVQPPPVPPATPVQPVEIPPPPPPPPPPAPETPAPTMPPGTGPYPVATDRIPGDDELE